MLRVELVPCLQDNYAHLVRDEASRKVAVIDPSEAEPVLSRLNELHWSLDYIVNTHHHWDHVGGNERLKKKSGAPVLASRYDRKRVPVCTDVLGEDAPFQLGETTFQILEIPGHTLGHIALYSAADATIFTGDTLFSLGCGRLFEGTPEQMWRSLNKIMVLPDETRIYCGHEYTESHLKFVKSVDGANPRLKNFQEEVLHLRRKHQPTVPAILGMEKELNPFLRAKDLADFTRLRELKNNFR